MPVILPGRWSQKPSGAVRLNPSHWLASDLRFLCAFDQGAAEPLDLVQGAPGDQIGDPWGSGAEGPGYENAGATTHYFEFPHHDDYNIVAEVSIGWVGYMLSGQSGTIIAKFGGSNQNCPWSMSFGNSDFLDTFRANTSWRVWQSQPAYTDRQLMNIVYAAPAAMQTAPAYYDYGLLRGSSVSAFGGSGSGNATTNTNPIRVGVNESAGAQGECYSAFAWVAARQLDAFESYEVSVNPYALLVPSPARSFVFMSQSAATFNRGALVNSEALTGLARQRLVA